MGKRLNNTIKIRRLEFDIRELIEKLEFSENSSGSGRIRKAIQVRLKAVNFLKNAERNYRWQELMVKFHFGESWKSPSGILS